MKVKNQVKEIKTVLFKVLKHGEPFLIPSMQDCHKYPFMKLTPEVHFSGFTPRGQRVLVYTPMQAVSLITGLPSELGEGELVIPLSRAKFLPFGLEKLSFWGRVKYLFGVSDEN